MKNTIMLVLCLFLTACKSTPDLNDYSFYKIQDTDYCVSHYSEMSSIDSDSKILLFKFEHEYKKIDCESIPKSKNLILTKKEIKHYIDFKGTEYQYVHAKTETTYPSEKNNYKGNDTNLVKKIEYEIKTLMVGSGTQYDSKEKRIYNVERKILNHNKINDTDMYDTIFKISSLNSI